MPAAADGGGGRPALAGAWLALAAIGAVVPLVPFLPWLVAHGLDLRRLVAELFGNRVGAFFGLDVLVSAVVVTVLAVVEGRRLGIRGWWLAVLATGLVGVSCGLPLLLALRERALARRG